MENEFTRLVPELTQRQSQVIDAYIKSMSVDFAAAKLGMSEIEIQAILSLDHVSNRVKLILDTRSKHINVDKYFVEQALVRIFHAAEEQGRFKEAVAALKLLGDIQGIYAPKQAAVAPPIVSFNMPAPQIDPDSSEMMH